MGIKPIGIANVENWADNGIFADVTKPASLDAMPPYNISGKVELDRLDLTTAYANMWGDATKVDTYMMSSESLGKGMIKLTHTAQAKESSWSRIHDTVQHFGTYKIIQCNNPRAFYVGTTGIATQIAVGSTFEVDAAYYDTTKEFYQGIYTNPNEVKNGDYIILELYSFYEKGVALVRDKKPDGKFALPQLATLGALTSKVVVGDHMVAQHANGTAIIQNPILIPDGEQPHDTQENSIINIYGIEGYSKLALYSPALAQYEVAQEIAKTVEIPKSKFNIPNYEGLVTTYRHT